jgi:hypothetical protein
VSAERARLACHASPPPQRAMCGLLRLEWHNRYDGPKYYEEAPKAPEVPKYPKQAAGGSVYACVCVCVCVCW